MGRKWNNPIGYLNKNRIYDLISQHPGLYQHEIIRRTKLSRQTVYTVLQELIDKGKIRIRNSQYFVEDQYLESMLLFAMIMEDSIRDIGHPDSFNEFQPKVAPQNQFEKSIFEFANKIGAFIVYILIESMRPSEDSTIPKDKRRSLVPRLIDRSIRSHLMYEAFSKYLEDFISERQKAEQIQDYCYITECFELKKEYYKKVIDAFKNIYPSIYNALENRWLEYVNLSLINHSRCKHEWEKIQVYKFGRNKYIGCCRCNSVIDSTDVRSKLLNQ